MTTIVGMQGDGFAVIVTDSKIVATDDSGSPMQSSIPGSGFSKVAANGRYLLGAAGDVRAINILHHVFQPPTPTPATRGRKLDTFITAKFIPALRACFEAEGYVRGDKDSSSSKAEIDSSVIVAINGVIYVIENDYSWTSDSTGVYALGSGSQYAIGSIHSLLKKTKYTPASAKAVLIRSLQVAGKFDPYTGAPFQAYIQEHTNGKKR